MVSLVASILLAPVVLQGELPKEAYSIVGRWDITVQLPTRKAYAWLEVEPSGRILVGRFVGSGGSARPIARVNWDKGSFSFNLPRQWEKTDLYVTGKLVGSGLKGVIKGFDSRNTSALNNWSAVRAPSLKRAAAPIWGEPLSLFDGKSLEGWKTIGRRPSQWSVKNGLLTNAEGGANLVTTRSFEDFKLLVEFRIPKGSNSGIYLRGRYEVQIEDNFGWEPGRHTAGAIYGFVVPTSNMCRAPGEWQRFEIELVGRKVTVVYNGERIIDRQDIPGITGGALDADEGKPGPIMIQGDHGPIELRRVVLTPANPG